MIKETNDTHDDQDLVTQEELRELVELEEIKRLADSRRQTIRKRILEGAKVEPGPCNVSISESLSIDLTKATVCELFGTLGDQILAALPRLQIFRMKLDPSTHTKYKAEPKAVFDPASMEDSDEPDLEFDLTTFVLNAIPMILTKQDADPSSSTMGNHVTNDHDEFDDVIGDELDFE